MEQLQTLPLGLDLEQIDPDQSGSISIDSDDSRAQRFIERFRAVHRRLPAWARRAIREIVLADVHRELDVPARQVLEFLNRRRARAVSGKRGFGAVDANLRLIRARLAEGYSADELRAIAAIKAREVEAGEFPAKYLRPATLFNAEKCAQYFGELGPQR